MTHKQFRRLKKELFGVKKFEIEKVKECPFIKYCLYREVYANCYYPKCLKCIEYKINDNLKINGKCRMNAIKKHTLQSNREDMRVKL